MTWTPPPTRTQLLWAAVDFDQTLAESRWTPENPAYEVGDPIAANVGKLFELKDAGYKIVIHSARGWEQYETVESWLQYHGIPFDKIVLGKLLAQVYCDDRAVNASADTWLPKAHGI